MSRKPNLHHTFKVEDKEVVNQRVLSRPPIKSFGFLKSTGEYAEVLEHNNLDGSFFVFIPMPWVTDFKNVLRYSEVVYDPVEFQRIEQGGGV